MRNYSQNLIDVIRDSLPESFASKASSILGESTEKTHRGINAAIPGVLGGLDDVASTGDGARRLASAVDGVDDSLLGNIGKLFGPGGTIVSEQGLGMLRSLFGADKLSRLSSNFGRLSGMSGTSISSLIGMLTPIIFSVLKKEKVSRGLDSTGLANLLAGQRGHIASAMAESETMEPVREVTAPRATTHRVETETTREPAATKRRGSWALPLALLAGLGLIWYLASRPRPEAARAPQETVHAAGEMARPRATFDELKTKYQGALDRARAEGVEVTALYEQNGKLVMKGAAPSMEAANSVREEIRRINPEQDDIIADLSVSGTAPGVQDSPRSDTQSTEPSSRLEKPSAAGSMEDSGEHTYTVESGDTLSTISNEFYGSPEHYMRIFDANKEQLRNPNDLRIGQELSIPEK